MSRPLRIEFENAFYHVMNRGRSHQQIFLAKPYYAAFLGCLETAHERFGLRIHCYCLMGNHYHLLVSTPRANLGRVMRHVNGVYTQKFNRITGTDGPLFRGRYRAILVDSNSYLLQVSRYIHRNPVETKKPLVERLEDYRWSSYRAYTGRESPPCWLELDTVLENLCGKSSPRTYEKFVNLGTDERTRSFYGQERLKPVFGGEAFADGVLQSNRAPGPEIPTLDYEKVVSIPAILAHVAAHFGVEPGDLITARRGPGRRNVPRWIAMRLCRDRSGKKLTEIARVFGLSHYSSVSQTIRRLDRAMMADRPLGQLVKKLSQDLTP